MDSGVALGADVDLDGRIRPDGLARCLLQRLRSGQTGYGIGRPGYQGRAMTETTITTIRSVGSSFISR